jgi:hypothetical protein
MALFPRLKGAVPRNDALQDGERALFFGDMIELEEAYRTLRRRDVWNVASHKEGMR